MVRVLLSVVQFRVNARYVDGKPPFIGIDLDHSDSGREGCAVSTLTVTSEPSDWRGATQVCPHSSRIADECICRVRTITDLREAIYLEFWVLNTGELSSRRFRSRTTEPVINLSLISIT